MCEGTDFQGSEVILLTWPSPVLPFVIWSARFSTWHEVCTNVFHWMRQTFLGRGGLFPGVLSLYTMGSVSLFSMNFDWTVWSCFLKLRTTTESDESREVDCPLCKLSAFPFAPITWYKMQILRERHAYVIYPGENLGFSWDFPGP